MTRNFFIWSSTHNCSSHSRYRCVTPDSHNKVIDVALYWHGQAVQLIQTSPAVYQVYVNTIVSSPECYYAQRNWNQWHTCYCVWIIHTRCWTGIFWKKVQNPGCWCSSALHPDTSHDIHYMKRWYFFRAWFQQPEMFQFSEMRKM